MAELEKKSYPVNTVEAVTFKLAAILGGRDAVLDSPTDEIFAYLDMQYEKEEAEAKHEQSLLYTKFLISVYSQPPREGEKPEMAYSRKQFIENLKPKVKGKQKVYEWSNIPPEVLAEAEKQKRLGGE